MISIHIWQSCSCNFQLSSILFSGRRPLPKFTDAAARKAISRDIHFRTLLLPIPKRTRPLSPPFQRRRRSSKSKSVGRGRSKSKSKTAGLVASCCAKTSRSRSRSRSKSPVRRNFNFTDPNILENKAVAEGCDECRGSGTVPVTGIFCFSHK